MIKNFKEQTEEALNGCKIEGDYEYWGELKQIKESDLENINSNISFSDTLKKLNVPHIK